MVLYKQVILTNLKSSPADTAKAFKELASFILSKGGVVRDVSHRGHRTLGYAIDDRRWGGTFERHREAKLLVKTFETSPATLKELEAKMKLSYSILRFTTFKVKKDPLRDVIKASATAPETEPVTPFNWKEFKAASTDDNTKVFEQEYVFEANGTSSNKHVPSKFDLMSQEDKDDLADWLMSKTQPEGALKQEAAKKDEFNLYGSVDDKDEEEADDEEDEDDDDDIAEWEDEEFEPTQDVPEWKRDSSYEPERPSKKGKDK